MAKETTRSVQEGFVVESEDDGFFYNRMGEWVRYNSPAKAYVWTPEEAASIFFAAENTKTKWPLVPKHVHPAVYDDASGMTVITGLRQKSGLPKIKKPVTVPDAGGALFDIRARLVEIGGNSVVAADASL